MSFQSHVQFVVAILFGIATIISSSSESIHSLININTNDSTSHTAAEIMITKTLVLFESPASSEDPVSTLEITTRDLYTDIIRSVLNMSVSELLSLVDQSVSRKRVHTLNALNQVNEIKKSLDSATAQKIDTLVASKLQHAVENVAPITNDLGRVLPLISNRMSIQSRDVADLIQIILDISLEQLLRKIQTALEQSDQLLVQVMNDLIIISNSVSNAQIAQQLREVSTLYLAQARAAILPILDSLYKVIPPMYISTSRGITADIFSEVLKFDVTEAANMFAGIWTDLKNILNKSLGRLETMPLSEDVRAEVQSAVEQTVKEVTSNLSPLLRVLVHFAYENNINELSIDRNLPKDIVDTLIGISLSDFLNYIDFAVYRTKQLGDAIQVNVIRHVATWHPELRLRIAVWAYTTVNQMKVAIKPFLGLIDPIMPPVNHTRKWLDGKNYRSSLSKTKMSKTKEDIDETFCDFSLKNGQNKEYIFHIVSKILKFEVSEAAETLIANIFEVEVMLNDHFERLSRLLHESNVETSVINQLQRVIEKALNDTKIVIQPGLDIFLLFAHNSSRHDKDVMADVVTTLSSITLDTFVQYSRYTVVFEGFIVENAVAEIRNVLTTNNVDSNVKEEVEKIVLSAVQSGAQIMSPFISAISAVLGIF